MINLLLYRFFDVLFQALYLLLFIRIALSWIPHNRFHPIVMWIYRLTDPILTPFQGILSPGALGGIDFSPILAFFALGFIRKLIFMILF